MTTTLNEDLHEAQAKLAADGGVITTTALFNLDGTIASGPMTHNRWGGRQWRLNDTATVHHGSRYVRPSHATKAATRRRFLRSWGFTVGEIRIAGTVQISERMHRVVISPDLDAFHAGRYEVVGTDTDV